MWGLSAGDVPAACVRVGLEPGEVSEAMGSKRKYVHKRIAHLSAEELLALARKLLAEYDMPRLDDFLSEMTVHAEHRVTDFTRKAVLAVLDDQGSLFGDVDVFEGLDTLAPQWEEVITERPAYAFPTLRRDVQRQYIDNDDYSNREVLERCGALSCSQRRFFALIEKVLHPLSRTGKPQAELAAALSALLAADGFAVAVAGQVSRHPVYGVRRIAPGVKGAPKNLIFAAVRTKPDLYFVDAINNDVAIRNKSDALIYDRLLPESGLAWDEMVTWWQETEGAADEAAARKALYKRLRDSVLATGSPGEYVLFDTYYRVFGPEYKTRLPALIPQVYLHYDPKTAAQRGSAPVLGRQRMDLLLLLNHGERVVLEVDGRQHYADDREASPAKYASMAVEDRKLRLDGYEVYRFGAAEFGDTEVNSDEIRIGPKSREVAREFFSRLFARHPIPTT
jgi:hypothetical protein